MELLIVIGVIGVLAAIGIVALHNIFESSRYNGDKRNAQNIASLYTAARAAGAEMTVSSPDDIIAVLVDGVHGKGPLESMHFKMGHLNSADITGAKRFLTYYPDSKLLIYGAATENPFNISGNGEVLENP